MKYPWLNAKARIFRHNIGHGRDFVSTALFMREKFSSSFIKVLIESVGSVIVPNGAKSATVKKIGGKSIVVDGEIKDGAVNAIEVVGKNIVDFLHPMIDIGGISTPIQNDDGSFHFETSVANSRLLYRVKVTPNKTYRICCGKINASGVGMSQSFQSVWIYDGISTSDNKLLNGAAIPYVFSAKLFTPTKNEILVEISLSGGAGGAICDVYYPMIWETTDATTYSSKYDEYAKLYSEYHEPKTIPVPSSIKSIVGYGRSAGNVYNEIDFDRKKFIQRVGVVDMGTLGWTYGTYQDVPYCVSTVIADIKHISILDMPNIMCSKYSTIRATSVRDLSDMQIFSWTNGTIFLRNDSITSADELKESLQGVMLYYELETPIETDISEIIDSFDVTNGDTIEFVNAINQAIPNTIEFACDPNEYEEPTPMLMMSSDGNIDENIDENVL